MSRIEALTDKGNRFLFDSFSVFFSFLLHEFRVIDRLNLLGYGYLITANTLCQKTNRPFDWSQHFKCFCLNLRDYSRFSRTST
jgi:hypothetical protein